MDSIGFLPEYLFEDLVITVIPTILVIIITHSDIHHRDHYWRLVTWTYLTPDLFQARSVHDSCGAIA